MAALGLTAVVAGCNSGASAAVFAGLATDGGSCAAPADSAVQILSPGAGGMVAAGPLTVIGESTARSDTVGWVLRDVTGAEVDSGRVSTESDRRPGTFTIPLELGRGAYRLTVQPASTPASSCDRVSIQVGDAGGPLPWISGVSGAGAVDGGFAEWRGRPVGMSGTWSDDNDAQVDLYTLQPDAEFGSWSGDLDIAVGAIDQRQGESWSAAARGTYDARWAQSLQNLAQLWNGRAGTLYIRFAHEFNGTWYPWSVDASEVDDFKASWERYRALQQQYFPSSRLVFAPNHETVGPSGLDWRDAFPGPDAVDVLSTSFFAYGDFTDVAHFWAYALSYDSTGAPRGLQRHVEFARDVGLPFAVSEWGGNGRMTDAPVYWREMYSFFNSNAGPGPGQVIYEVVFNVARDAGAFLLQPTTLQPMSAEVYRQLW